MAVAELAGISCGAGVSLMRDHPDESGQPLFQDLFSETFHAYLHMSEFLIQDLPPSPYGHFYLILGWL